MGPKQDGIYFFKPGFQKLYLEYQGEIVSAKQLDPSGLFFYPTKKLAQILDYRVYQRSGGLSYDPYAFWPTLEERDFEGFHQGVDYEVYKKLGAHSMMHQGVLGVRFAVWAPNAKGCLIAYDDNHFSETETPMRLLGSSGVFELFIPGFQQGQKYKFCLIDQLGNRRMKADPYGFFHEKRPANASVFFEQSYDWQDALWMKKREQFIPYESPVNIYEVHLGSWKRENGEFLSYEKLGHQLAQYCKEMGYTHVEIMPVLEHPLDESWGYQVTGFYSVTARFGNPIEFKKFVDLLHQSGIGVILDWVGAHFPKDEHGLIRFDGTSLYEHEDPKKGHHPQWHTAIFNYGRNEVSNFLIGSVLFWLKEMHLDGIRMDAVSSMLYLDFGRSVGDFIPNCYGGIENLEAIDWLKHLNVKVHEMVPGVMMIAEESTAFPKVTHPVYRGGLGFDFKSNLGWMHDTLAYFQKDPIYRRYHHDQMTFYLMYAFTENFALFLSHDEVVHGKKSLISKMPGCYEDQFKNLKLLIGMMMTLPGKKLLFMGGEFGQWNEWNESQQLDWTLLQFPRHDDLKRFVSRLNHIYLEHSSFWKQDHDWSGFEWIECQDQERSVFAFIRKDGSKMHLCVHNASAARYPDYFIRLDWVHSLVEIFHSESVEYGGCRSELLDVRRLEKGFLIDLPLLSTVLFEIRLC